MVNFRFHLVSIVAVFLALALGIGMGVTVIDKATVDLLKQRIDADERSVNAANQRSDSLNRQLNRNESYQSLVEDYMVTGQLAGVRVTVIAFKGIDTGPLNELKKTVEKAGATFTGTLWFPEKDRLTNNNDISNLQRDLAVQSSDAASLRQALAARVSAIMAGTSDAASLKPLIDDGYLDWEGDNGANDVAKINFAETRLLVASSYNPNVPNDQLAQPLAKLLISQPSRRVVAVESGREPDDKTSGERAVFLSPLRSDNAITDKFSSVDNIESQSGRVAVVLALRQLPEGRSGHYGVASSAQSQIPKRNP